MQKLTGSPDNYIEYFKHSPIFENLSGEEIESFLKNSRYILYKINSKEKIPIDASCLIITLSGELITYVISESGNKRVVDVFTPENPLIPTFDVKVFSTVGVCAKKPSIALQLARDSFMSVNPSVLLIQHTIMKNILNEFYAMSSVIIEHLVCLSETTARDKVVSYIAKLYTEQKQLTLTLPFDRNHIADYLQMDTSTLARELKRLKLDNIIDYENKTITVKNLDGIYTKTQHSF